MTNCFRNSDHVYATLKSHAQQEKVVWRAPQMECVQKFDPHETVFCASGAGHNSRPSLPLFRSSCTTYGRLR